MFQLTEKYPEKRDSLLTVLYEKELPSILRESRNLALKYAAVPSGLKRLFMVRLEIPKDTLSRILKSLSPEIRESFYGKCLHRHIITKQIEEGDLYFDFPRLKRERNGVSSLLISRQTDSTSLWRIGLYGRKRTYLFGRPLSKIFRRQFRNRRFLALFLFRGAKRVQKTGILSLILLSPTFLKT